MSNQLVITSGAKVRNLSGVLTGTSGVVSSVPYGGANGVATLDGSGKVPLSQLPASVITYLGTWNASTNTPTLTNGVGDTGDLYICNVAGTVNFGAGPITFAVGDWVIYSGTTWEKSGGASGTVTSVAMTVPTGLSVTGSPITTSGTLAVSLASGYTIPTTSFLSGLVPYTGATGNVNLGEYGLSGGYLGLDTTPTGTPTSVGTLSWDTTYLTPKVVTGTGATTLQIGQEEVILIHNNTGSTLTDGQVVYVTGSTGELPSVSLADASSETTSAATLGVITETIANGANGFATVSGIVHGLNTLAYNEGDILWLSETAGQFTNVKPISPAHLVLIGYVIKKAGGNGSILVKIQNTQELKECSDVLFTSLANNDILAYESSTDLWKNKTIANVLGYTPANDSLVVKLAGTQTITGQKTFTSLIYANNNIVLPIAGSSSITYLANIAGTGMTSSGSNYIGFNTNNDFYFAKDNYHSCVFVSNNSAVNYYTLQDGSGTLAFTSDIPSLTNYVTLNTLQTITGVKFFNAEASFDSNIVLTGGDFVIGNSGFDTSINTETLTASRSINFPNKSGVVAMTSDIPSLSGYVQGSGTTNYISKFTASGTIGNSLLFDNGTNIGIGNTTPSYKFDVNGTGRYTGNLMVSSALGFAIGDITSYQRIQHNAGTFSFLTSANGNASITAGGATFSSSVGIGTTSPSQILQTETATGTNNIHLYSLSGTTKGFIGVAGIANSILNEAAVGDVVIRSQLGKILLGTFQSGGSDAYAALTIANNRNVGIGTSSPQRPLEVVGTFRNTNPSGSNFSQIYNDATGAWFSTGAYPMMFETNGTERMRITSGGALQLASSAYFICGTTGYRFNDNTDANNNVIMYNNGNMNIRGGLAIGNTADQNGVFYIASQVMSSNAGTHYLKWNSSNGKVTYDSSTRLVKSDIIDSPYGLNEILQLKPRKYYRTDDERNEIGFIADEVYEILPELVPMSQKSLFTKDENDTELIPSGVNYDKITAVLVKAIQELNAKVSALENKS